MKYLKETATMMASADYKGNPTYKMEPGKYYVLHPVVVTELEGLFALEFAEWTCGME